MYVPSSGAWATQNARDVGLMDAEALADFDYASLAPRRLSGNPLRPGDDVIDDLEEAAAARPVSRAKRSASSASDGGDAAAGDCSEAAADGLGLASMIKADAGASEQQLPFDSSRVDGRISRR